MQNSANKKSDPIEIFIMSFFKSIAAIFRSVFYGIKRLNNVKALLGLLFFSIAAVGAYALRDEIFRIDAPEYVHWMIYCALLASPLLYLCALGASQSRAIREYCAKFTDINFVGKDKKYPVLLYKKEDGKKEILAFKSNIPLAVWDKSKPQLETALDCSIANIEQLGSKKKVKLTTINSSYQLPTSITWSDDLINPADGVIIVGENNFGPVAVDVNESAHILIAGGTGSGKSVETRCITWQFLVKGAIAFFFDFKGGVEFGKKYEKYGEVITTKEKALEVLQIINKEKDLRLAELREYEVNKITELNAIKKERGEKEISRIIIFFDEVSEATDKTGAVEEDKKLINGIIGEMSTTARQGRAPGINMVLATQRPDAQVLPGQIKNNCPVRICGRFKDESASEIVLGNTSAKRLPKIPGRFVLSDEEDAMMIQGYFFKDKTMLREVDTKEHHVLCPELAKRLVSSSAAAAPVPMEEKTQKPTEHDPSQIGTSVVKLDFDYRKAVNK